MIIIPIKENENIERALKRYKRKFNNVGVLKDLRTRRNFVKPSVVKREKMAKAIYKLKMQLDEEE